MDDIRYLCLFDDIITTGATMRAMQSALIDHGFDSGRIFGLTVFDYKY